jgi:hypothetical protein
MVESLWLSERRALERFVSTQPPYSIFTREAEREILPVCQARLRGDRLEPARRRVAGRSVPEGKAGA